MEAEGRAETLAEKYRSFNKAVDDATSNPMFDMKYINYDEPDIDNLLRIEVASRRKNVNIILDVFKSKDMLYAFRAIKLSTWLITDDKYKHLINPEYIHKNLLPHMTLKAFNKLMQKIRITLRDAKRVDEFFNYLKEKDLENALKWLPYCSADLAADIIEKFYDKITLSTIEKFSNNSSCVYLYCKKKNIYFTDIRKAENILKIINVDKYLSYLFDLIDSNYTVNKLSPDSTKRLIKRCPHKTLDDFLCFQSVIHIPTLLKYFNGEEIKNVLIKHSQNKTHESLFKYDKLKYFVARLPQKDKFDLIRNVFIGKAKPVYTKENDLQNSTMIRCLTNMNNAYLWCEFLPFDEAFNELKRFIDLESNPAKKSYMICTLLSSTHKNLDRIKIVLQYYVNSHLNEGLRFKTQFLQHFLHEVNILKLKADSWNLLNILFYNVGVYTKFENSFPKYKPNPFIIIGRQRKRYDKRELQSDEIFVNSIILYNTIYGIDIPEFILTKFKHTTFKEFIHSINNHDKVKLYKFLFEILKTKLDNHDVKDINNFGDILLTIRNIYILLKDWNKKMYDYPEMLIKIQEIRILLSHEKYDCSELDSLMKSMDFKLEIEKSDNILADSCMQILKTNPHGLLQLITKKDISWKFNRKPMRRFLCKLRCYWHDTIATDFKRISLNHSSWDIPWGLLNQKDIMELMQQHFSTEKSNCDERFAIAKYLHLMRPCLALETILDLCKEKEMHFVSSIHSLIYNIDPTKICNIFLKLQNVCLTFKKKSSLQKHCLNVVLKRLNYNEKMTTFKEIWKLSDNELSRLLVFKEVFRLLQDGTDKERILDNWNVLKDFIDDITESDALNFIEILINPINISNEIISEYNEKVESFLKTLTDESHIQKFTMKSHLESDQQIIDLHKKLKYIKYPPHWLQEYILYTNTEKIQMERYEKLLSPFKGNEKMDLSDYQLFILILRCIYRDFDSNITYKKAVVPTAILTDIQRRLEERLPFYDNYVLLTAGRLFLGYLRIFNENDKSRFSCSDEISRQNQRNFGIFCADYLDEEIEKHFPTIYISFSDAIAFLFTATNMDNNLNFFDGMISRNARAECFLAIVHHLPRKTYRTPDDILFRGILEKMKTHPSDVVRMHYSNYFIKTDSL